MARVSSLLRLNLILCYCVSQMSTMRIKMISKPPEAVNARVELDCETGYPEVGVYWVRQIPGRDPDFILYMSARSQPRPSSSPYETSKSGQIYKLIVKRFQKQDEGMYSCIVLHNQVLHFSSGLPVFLPVRTTPAPTTQRRALTTPDSSNGDITNEPSKCSDAIAAASYDGHMVPCNPYIWIPLSSGCLLLLISLLITIMVCSDPRRRRRRCQCKRPVNGTNGKPMPR